MTACNGNHTGAGARVGTWTAEQCRICWHKLNPAPTAPIPQRNGSPPPARPACLHLGSATGEAVRPACGRCDPVPLYHCAVHGTCTPGEPTRNAHHRCVTCGQYEAPPPPAFRRHLLYHLYPRRAPGWYRGPTWRWNVGQLLARIDLFDGRRVVAAVADHHTDPAGDVRDAMAGHGIELIELANDPGLREVATHEALFSRVADLSSPEDVTLWAHAKGVTNFTWADGGTVIRQWIETLHETYLDYWPVVAETLTHYPVAGSLRRQGRYFAPRSASVWHYAGSWCWYRNRDLFARNWRHIDRFDHGIEPYPSLHFGLHEAGVIFGDLDQPGEPSWPYRKQVWDDLSPHLERWRQDNAGRRTVFAPAPAVPVALGIEGLRLDIGCGEKKKPGWLGIDQRPLPGVDHVVNLECEPLPFPDDSASEVYSSHALEHIADMKHFLWEVVRVLKVGGRFELRVPHHLSSMAMCHGHRQVIPPLQVEHWTKTALAYWWQGSPKRLRHLGTEQVPGENFEEARRLFPQMSAEQVMRLVPGCAHEHVYTFTVTRNEDCPS